MARTARQRLAEAIEEFGEEGTVEVRHDPFDPCGYEAEGADLPPHDGISRPRDLLDRVRQVNARSRGEIL